MRTNGVPIYVNYMRLVMYAFGFEAAWKRHGVEPGDMFFAKVRCDDVLLAGAYYGGCGGVVFVVLAVGDDGCEAVDGCVCAEWILEVCTGLLLCDGWVLCCVYAQGAENGVLFFFCSHVAV